jgi:alkylhydroperoxidase family enzyme
MRGGLLDRGTLTLAEREIMILRTTARCGSEYEWGVHVKAFAEKARLSDAQVRSTVKDDSTVWSARELAIIRLADTLHDRSSVDDALWTVLREHFSEEQLIELVALGGQYHMISYVTNAFGIYLEPDAARF